MEFQLTIENKKIGGGTENYFKGVFTKNVGVQNSQWVGHSWKKVGSWDAGSKFFFWPKLVKLRQDLEG